MANDRDYQIMCAAQEIKNLVESDKRDSYSGNGKQIELEDIIKRNVKA